MAKAAPMVGDDCPAVAHIHVDGKAVYDCLIFGSQNAVNSLPFVALVVANNSISLLRLEPKVYG